MGHQPQLPRLLPEVEQVLNDSGLPWELVLGTKHWHLRIAGRLTTLLPMAGGKSQQNKMERMRHRTLRDIRRMLDTLSSV